MSSEATSNRRPGLVLTAVGPDRRGLVKELSSHVRKYEGNIEDTRMSKLGGEFAFLMLITGKESDLVKLQASLDELENNVGLKCFAKRTQAEPSLSAGKSYRLEASGLDRTGIVETITQILVERNINVASFSSRVENAPHSGTPLFLLDARIEIPNNLNVVEFERDLLKACEREHLEFILNQD